MITGIGLVNTAYQLGKTLSVQPYDLALNAGVAGSFDPKILRGSVLEVISEQYGDLGVEEADGNFTDMFELKLIDGTKKPFSQGKLLNNKPLNIKNIKTCRGLTVQKVHGTTASIEATKAKYAADIETMEGAAFFQTCLTEGVAFAQLRAISNFVEPRNRENWLMDEAIKNLNQTLIEIFDKK
ncbi:MAG: futalosine hydrolase [Saprospiraceae bacterium]|nr:futalosine hydrolase [Saprospiraceae bacterium]